MTQQELNDSAISEFKKFCEKNNVQPTKTIADCFFAGYERGVSNASQDLWSLTPEELKTWLGEKHIKGNDELVDTLNNIANGYKVRWERNIYDIKKVYFIKHDKENCTAVMVSFIHPLLGYRLEHFCDVYFVPF